MGFGEGFSDFAMDVDPVSVESAGPVLKIDADLGVLKSGDRGIAVVTLRNPFDHDIPIADARASCKCANAKLLGTVIPAGGTAKLVLAVTVSLEEPSPQFTGTVTLGVDRSARRLPLLRDVIVSIRYEITGMLCFVDRQATVAVLPDADRTLMVPFVATIPGVPDGIEVDGTGFLHGVPGAIVQQNDGWFVKLEVNSDMASPHGVFGNLTLRADEHGVNDTIRLALYLENDIQISPRTLRFRRVDDRYEASAILHLSNNRANDGDRHAAPTSEGKTHLFCEASIAGNKIRVKTQRLTNKVFRLTLIFDGTEEQIRDLLLAPPGDRRVEFSVIDRANRHSVDSPFLVNP